LTAHALASDEKQVIMLANKPSFTAYGIYAADRTSTETASHGSSHLRRVIVINLQEFNATQAAASRPYIKVNLENLLGPACQARDVQVRRLTGPGADAKDGASFAGLEVDSYGRLVGREKVKRLERGAKVFVSATKAVLVSIE
jgi:hypothetical protein